MTVAVATVATYALPLFLTASLALDSGAALDMTVAPLRRDHRLLVVATT